MKPVSPESSSFQWISYFESYRYYPLVKILFNKRKSKLNLKVHRKTFKFLKSLPKASEIVDLNY